MKKYFLLIPIFVFLIASSIVFYYKFDQNLLTKLSFYVNLANPYMRIVRVEEGMRKEEVAEMVADKLDWDQNKINSFINGGGNVEGHLFPKTYLIYKDDDPSTVRATMVNEFSNNLSKVNKPKSKKIINEETALKIASIVQREAAGKSDMPIVSGVIWNRIFNGMKLQIDATLQYAKGNGEDGWWTRVTPEDKDISSSYNTYKVAGLPPGAIANPGMDAINAAYNPAKTSCLFYLHDKHRRIHCAKTYEEHKRNIEIYLK